MWEGASANTLTVTTHYTDGEAETKSEPAYVRGERGSYPVGRLEASVVSNVLSKRVSSIHWLPVHAVVAVLLHHALSLLLECLH